MTSLKNMAGWLLASTKQIAGSVHLMPTRPLHQQQPGQTASDQPLHVASGDEAIEIHGYLLRNQWRAKKKPHLYVALVRRLSEICRGHENVRRINNDTLCM